MSRILIITDAWDQINGVVTTFINTIRVLREQGNEVSVIHPGLFKTTPLPTYPEIKIAINPWKVGKLIEDANADEIHIATEGPIGLFATWYCRRKKYAFTTSYHTKMPEYLKTRFKWLPIGIPYAYMRHLHRKSKNILVTTQSMKDELILNGFKNDITVWGRGVDTSIFNDNDRTLSKLPRLLYVGRISPEKNLEAYLDMPTYGIKYVVGDGPLLEHYKEKYQNDTSIKFVGPKKGKELQQYYVDSEVLVFPSKTDTFGIVMLEAMACGTPVAAYPVTGPIDCVENNVTGVLHDSLGYACHLALLLNRDKIAKIGQTKTWESCTQIFQDSLVHK